MSSERNTVFILTSDIDPMQKKKDIDILEMTDVRSEWLISCCSS